MDLLDKDASPEYALQCIKWCLDHDEVGALSEHLKLHIKQLSNMEDDIANLLSDAVSETKTEGLRTLLLYIDDVLMSKKTSERGKCLVDKLLCQGIEQGHRDIVENLLQRGGDECMRYHGKPILHLAVLSGHLDVAESLLEYGADIKEKDRRGDDILHSVIVSQREDKVEAVRWLLNKGIDVHKTSSSGKSPLHLAAGQSPKVVTFLLDLGCDVNLKDAVNCDTPMHIACAMSCHDVICKLIQFGAKFNLVNNQGQTPLSKLLQFAQGHNDFHSKTRLKIAKYLIQIGFRMPEPTKCPGNKCKPRRKGRNKIYDSYVSLFASMQEVPSLQSLTRCVVMDAISSGVKVSEKVTQLGLPVNLQKYLLFKERHVDKFHVF